MSNRIAEMAKKKRGGGEEEDGKLRDKLRAFLRDRNESNQQRVTDLFNILDVDHSAKISKTELSRTLGEMGFVVTPKQMDMIFASFDVDKNGTIEYMEFFNFFRRTDEYPDLPPAAAARHEKAGATAAFVADHSHCGCYSRDRRWRLPLLLSAAAAAATAIITATTLAAAQPATAATRAAASARLAVTAAAVTASASASAASAAIAAASAAV